MLSHPGTVTGVFDAPAPERGLEPIAIALALPAPHLDCLGDVRHDTVHYLILLLPIAWGTAAFGEELVHRGFLNTRLRAVFGGGRVAVALAAVGQAVLFGMGHAYLGPRGILNAAAIGQRGHHAAAPGREARGVGGHTSACAVLEGLSLLG